MSKSSSQKENINLQHTIQLVVWHKKCKKTEGPTLHIFTLFTFLHKTRIL